MNISNILKEKKYLQDQIKSIDLELRHLPNKDFYSAKNGNTFKWYESDGKVSTYIKKKRRGYAERLAKRKFLLAKKKDLHQEITALDFYLRHHNATEGEALKLLNNPAYATLLASCVNPVDQELQEWMDAPYDRNELFPEGLIHKINTGLFVRSKSEMLIVMQLQMKQIPFRYECLLKLGDSKFYPDFTIKHPKTGQIFYWEHFGKMDDEEYRKSAFAKMHMYAQHGIILGVNMIATFETKDHPVDADWIEKMIDYYFT